MYRQGGSAGGNVFITMAAAVAAGIALGGAAYTIVIDSTDGAPIVPSAAGALDLRNATLLGQAGNPQVTLTFQTGATIGLGQFPTRVQDLVLASTSVSAVHSMSNLEAIAYGPNAGVTGNAAAPFFSSTGGIVSAISMIGPASSLGDGANQALSVTSPSTVTLIVDFDTQVNADAVVGSGTLITNPDAQSTTRVQTVTTLTPSPSGAARNWADNGATLTPSDTAVHILTSVTVTPATTGRFRLTVSGLTVNNSNVLATGILVGVNHGNVVTAADYSFASPNLPAGLTATAQFGGVVDLDKTGLTFPLGTAVQFNVLFQSTVASTAGVNAHGCQLEVQELTP